MTRKVLVTSALPYVNNVPHLGNLVGATLSADVYARFCRSRGDEVLYVCGTDEHGTATEVKAREEGVTPKQLCDKYFALHKAIYEWFGMSFDVFGRTSDHTHVEVTQHIFSRLNARGFIFEQEVEQLYSEHDKMFLADRYVLGTCPKCEYPDARGDQCDKCGALLTPLELINPRSAMSGETPVIKRTKHLFIDLPALQPALSEWLSNKHFSQNTMKTTYAWLERGLEPRAITRDLTWGVPVPKQGFENKVFYVWFDAPIGYISMTGATSTPTGESGSKAINYWWRDQRTELYQFMGKDNIPFHSVLFPAMLLGAADEWITVKHINTTEFLNFEGDKFSKSRGVGLFGDQAMELGIPADVFRYYLLVNRPEQADTSFSWNDFQAKLNGELVANLGNLVNRTLSFINQYYEGKIPAHDEKDADTAFAAEVKNAALAIRHELETVKIKDALKSIMKASMTANGFFQRREPWRTRKENPAECAATIAVLANFLVDLSIMMEPFMPHTAREVCAQLNTKLPARWETVGNKHLAAGHAIAANKPLFRKIEDAEVAELRERFSGGQKETQKKSASHKEKAAAAVAPVESERALDALELTVAKILSVEKHPNAEKLYIEKLDMGAGVERTIVSGLAPHYSPEGLVGKHIIVVSNLAPAKLRGVVSDGMLLAAEEEASGTVGVLMTTAAPGTQLLGGGKPQITYDVFSRVKFEQRADGLYADGVLLTADGADIVADGGITGSVK